MILGGMGHKHSAVQFSASTWAEMKLSTVMVHSHL